MRARYIIDDSAAFIRNGIPVMRPRYETQQDRDNEQMAIAMIERAWQCKAKKLPIAYGFDFGLYRDGQLQATVEVKKRSKRYKTLMLSLLKVHHAAFMRWLGIKPFLVIWWPDGLYYHEVVQSYNIGWGFRKGRGDWQDEEPVIYIPFEDFTKICDAEAIGA